MKKQDAKSNPAAFLFAALAAACVARLFFLDTAVVSGDSMLPGLENGRRVFVSKMAWGVRLPLSTIYFLRWSNPEPGDVVVFLRNGTRHIKRCAATEGMDIVFSGENGYSITVGNTRLPLSKAQYEHLSGLFFGGAAEAGKTRIPPGAAFVTGDNPTASVDSRDYGLVDVDSFCGKVLL